MHGHSVPALCRRARPRPRSNAEDPAHQPHVALQRRSSEIRPPRQSPGPYGMLVTAERRERRTYNPSTPLSTRPTANATNTPGPAAAPTIVAIDTSPRPIATPRDPM